MATRTRVLLEGRQWPTGVGHEGREDHKNVSMMFIERNQIDLREWRDQVEGMERKEVRQL